MNVKVITDSTADIPKKLANQLGITIVPICVRFGDKTYRDGQDISIEEFYSSLKASKVHPATSQPNPEDFVNAYKEYCDAHPGIVSIHISSKISGTFNSASMARKTMKSRCPIEVIDSGLNSGGLGLVVLAAARFAQAGASHSEVTGEAQKAVAEVRMFGIFETMKYLARSGRVNKTIAAASRILNVMPLLTFQDGEIVRAGLARTISIGMNRIYQFVESNLPICDLSIVHSQVPDQARKMKQRLSEFIHADKISIFELGAGLGVHGGPGVLLVCLRRSGNT
ncbi:DegV family protein [Chloroflexota bacterium]